MRGGELITSDESALFAKPLLDPIVVENSQSDGCLANPSDTNESNRNEVLGEIDYLLDQLVASKQVPRWQRR
jgi:hypothetical protein